MPREPSPLYGHPDPDRLPDETCRKLEGFGLWAPVNRARPNWPHILTMILILVVAILVIAGFWMMAPAMLAALFA